jgi:1-acyl-sn-glycerol-3-phosphate acyltransferase
VIVANHPSLLDIIMLLAAVPNITFLAKASWFSSPFIGPLLRFGHHIAGPEGGSDASPMDGAMVLDRILTQLRAGYPVMLFPEGTRSPANGLGPFKRGAFEAAVRAGVPLCCLRVRVDPPVLLKGQPWWKVPKRRISFEVSMLQTIAPEAFGDSARRLCGDVRHAYLHALELQ